MGDHETKKEETSTAASMPDRWLMVWYGLYKVGGKSYSSHYFFFLVFMRSLRKENSCILPSTLQQSRSERTDGALSRSFSSLTKNRTHHAVRHWKGTS